MPRVSPPGLAGSAYTPQQAGQFTLAGHMKLNSILGSDYSLDITLTVDDTGPVSTVTPTTQAINDPFSIGGIVLSDLSLTVTYTWPSRPQGKPQSLSFTLGGHMKLGTGQGALSSVSGGPVLFDVALDADFSLGAFLAQCLTGNGANWPADFIDFALLSGTRIYYYDEAADDSAHSHSTLDGITFQPRFNVDAQLRLTQVTSITLHGVLTVLTDRTTGAYIGVQVGILIDNSLDLVENFLSPVVVEPYSRGEFVFNAGHQLTRSLQG